MRQFAELYRRRWALRAPASFLFSGLVGPSSAVVEEDYAAPVARAPAWPEGAPTALGASTVVAAW